MNLPKPIYTAATLGLLGIIALGLVALVYQGTRERIEFREQAALRHTLESLIPADAFDNDILADVVSANDRALGTDKPVPIYRARKDGKPVAAVLSPIALDGYNGAIKLLVAIRMDGSLAGVRVVSHRETPGFGDPIEVDSSDWIFGFDGRSLCNPPESRWKVRRDGGDFDQFTGATITPRAVVKAVYKTLIFFERNKARLFEQEAGSTLGQNP